MLSEITPGYVGQPEGIARRNRATGVPAAVRSENGSPSAA
jgi:hypothetical protein